jgi:hypothetical protein
MAQLPNLIFSFCHFYETLALSSLPIYLTLHQYLAAKDIFTFLLSLPMSCSATLLMAHIGIIKTFLQNFF